MQSATDNHTTDSIIATTGTPSPAKMYKRWELPSLFCPQSAQYPSPVDSDWSEEDWDTGIKKEKEGRGDGAKARRRRKEEIRFKLLPIKPMYVPSYEEELPALVRDLIPKLAPEKPRDIK